MIKLLLLITSIAFASANNYNFNCAKPLNKGKPTSNYEIQKHNEQSRSYKACVDAFIRENKEIRNNATNALNFAISEWNHYANGTQPTKDKSQKFVGSQNVPKGGSHTVGHNDPYNISTSFKF